MEITRTENQQQPTASASWQRAYDRAMQRGDWERVAQMMAVPMDQRPTWSPR